LAVAEPSDPSAAYAAFGAELRFEDLPVELVATLKRIVYDTLGTTLAGTTLGSGCPELLDLVRRAGGARESTLLGSSSRVPAAMAALANGATAHALNYDDVFPGGGHLGVVTLPAALAVAERQGGISGKDLLAALGAGVEIMARLLQAVRNPDDGTSEAKPQPTQMLGAFAAAMTAAHVLKLDTSRTWSALGLALMQASGNRQPVLQGAPAKALYAAFPSQAGVLSAQLAECGVGAQCDAFEGEAGLFATSYGNVYNRAALLDELGARFVGLEVGFKPWPTTNRAHPFIEAALQIASAHRLHLADIQRVVVVGGPHIRAFCEPIQMRRHPTGWVQAEDSIPFSVAKALVNGRVVLADFGPEGLRQRQVAMLCDRLDYRIDRSIGAGGVVEVTLAGGQRIVEHVAHALGHASRPLSEEALRGKFFDCGTHAANGVSRPNLERVLDAVEHLEDIEDVTPVAHLLGSD
jgi:2-methylcitrate dehydratase PrpD